MQTYEILLKGNAHFCGHAVCPDYKCQGGWSESIERRRFNVSWASLKTEPDIIEK